jgi:preprotein translocase subunit SecD
MSQRFIAPFAIVLLIAASLACSTLRPKRSLTWSVSLETDAPVADREAALAQIVKVIEARLNAVGLSRFEVKTLGAPANGRILVSLPDVPDHERLKRLITAVGRLELTHVVSPPSPAPSQTYGTREEAISSLGGAIPASRQVLPYTERDHSDGPDDQRPKRWVVVESPAIVDGRELRNATAVPLRDSDYQIVFSLKSAGAEKFGAWTAANVNEYIGVVLNGEVKSIAYIKGQISDQGAIDGRFSKQSAEDLALILRSGSLPANLRIIEERTIK